MLCDLHIDSGCNFFHFFLDYEGTACGRMQPFSQDVVHLISVTVGAAARSLGSSLLCVAEPWMSLLTSFIAGQVRAIRFRA